MNPHNESPISSKGTERAPEKNDSSLDRSSASLQAEASPAMGDLNAMIVQKRQESKAQRNERLSSQFRKTGEAAVGEITRQFGCSIELSDKRKGSVVVAGRSSEDLAKLEELKSAANTDSLIGKGGAIVPMEENRSLIGPKDGQSRDAQQLYDETTGEFHIGKRTYSRDQVVADTSQGTASDASRSNLKHDFMLYPGDSRFNYPDGVDYIVRNDRTIDKFNNGKYLGTAIDETTNKPFHATGSRINFPGTSDVQSFGSAKVHFEDQSHPKQMYQGRVEEKHPADANSKSLEGNAADTADAAEKGLDKTKVDDKPESFYSSSFKVHFKKNGYDTTEVVNVNISDKTSYKGASISDGLPHREVFSIRTADGFYKRMEATVQVEPDGASAKFQLHRMSPGTGDGRNPDLDKSWDVPYEDSYTLNKRATKVKLTSSDFDAGVNSKEPKNQTYLRPERHD